mgnify:FL=1
MTASHQSEISFDEFKQMADRAGLGMTTEELKELKPLYDLYSQYTYLLHNIELGSEEIDLMFHPDWPQTSNG